MAEYLNELEHVEQELDQLRNHFEQSFAVLEGLAKVQAQFEDLAQTYQNFKEYVEEVKATQGDTAQLQETFNHRFAELEKVIKSRWGEVKSELLKVQNEQSIADLNLSTKLTDQVNNLKAEVEEQLTVLQQEWTSYKDKSEAKFRTELQAAMNQLGEAGFNEQNFEKQERMERELQLATSFLHDMERQVQNMERQMRNMERQMRVMSNWLIVAVLTTVLALGLALALGLLKSRIM